jgi:hypothetical protein
MVPFPTLKHMEQSTYLEWLNSRSQTEIAPVTACNSGADSPACGRTCQDCHMPRGYRNAFGGKEIVVDPIRTKFAVIEDQDYPQADHRMGLDKIRVRFRDSGFVRHELAGANAFVMEMFRQNNELLGVRLSDYMSGVDTGLASAIANTVRQVQSRTARIEVSARSPASKRIVAEVTVVNLTGHRFPSGVGFRRAFIEFLVLDTSGGRSRVVWSSGRTNGVGVIVDNHGKPLPSEFFEDYVDASGGKQQHYQEHHAIIQSDQQVQIYEELTQDAEGRFTTSFLRRDHGIKDNRLLPFGWTPTGPDPKNFGGDYLQATFPEGLAAKDPQYRDGSGTDVVTYDILLPDGVDPKSLSVQATLYYQSIPPYYLAMRFNEAPDGPATKRLYYLASTLKVEGTAIADWKLRVVGTGPVPVARD